MRRKLDIQKTCDLAADYPGAISSEAARKWKYGTSLPSLRVLLWLFDNSDLKSLEDLFINKEDTDGKTDKG